MSSSNLVKRKKVLEELRGRLVAKPISKSRPILKKPQTYVMEKGDVLIWSGEDGISDTLMPRFLAAGGDASRIHFVGGVPDRGKARPFDPAVDMPKLTRAARELPSLCLLILDPMVAAVAGDSHKNSETRRGLQPVVDLAAELDVAGLGITHLSKGTAGRDVIERVTGSIAFSAVARVVLATVKAADPEAPRRLVRAKSNLGPDMGGFEYQLFGAPVPGHDFNAQRVDWGGARGRGADSTRRCSRRSLPAGDVAGRNGGDRISDGFVAAAGSDYADMRCSLCHSTNGYLGAILVTGLSAHISDCVRLALHHN